eukprot:UN07501
MLYDIYIVLLQRLFVNTFLLNLFLALVFTLVLFLWAGKLQFFSVLPNSSHFTCHTGWNTTLDFI